MNLTEIRIIKRDGKQENFSAAKITNAIGKAFEATGIPQQREELDLITRQVVSHFSQPTIGVEEIQDLVENELMKVQPEVAKKYIIYRQWRNTERDRKTHIKHIMDGIVAIDKNDVNLSNANMSSHTRPDRYDFCFRNHQGLYLQISSSEKICRSTSDG